MKVSAGIDIFQQQCVEEQLRSFATIGGDDDTTRQLFIKVRKKCRKDKEHKAEPALQRIHGGGGSSKIDSCIDELLSDGEEEHSTTTNHYTATDISVENMQLPLSEELGVKVHCSKETIFAEVSVNDDCSVKKRLLDTLNDNVANLPPIMRKRWYGDEEAYAKHLIKEFQAGLLPLANGTTLRSFLAETLNCDPNRISRK